MFTLFGKFGIPAGGGGRRNSIPAVVVMVRCY